MRNFYKDYTWSFLIADPSLSEPFFEESVILLLEDNEEGSFGVIINKPMEKTLRQLNSDIGKDELAEVEVFEGGPIAPERVSLAMCYDNSKDDGAFSFGLSPEKALEIMRKNETAKVAAFAGYSGWSAKQLQTEIAEGNWIVSNADVNIMFEIPPDELWRYLVLRERPDFENLEPPESSPELN